MSNSIEELSEEVKRMERSLAQLTGMFRNYIDKEEKRNRNEERKRRERTM